MKVWILLLSIYAAPPNAVDWDGPWVYGLSQASKNSFSTEAECRNFGIQLAAKMHQGMLAPIRFQCVSFDANLPKGATR